ncbi:MAG: type 1 glutamine amidotransferase [Gallionella sp.]|nr:type 1 glutamine amidotransferase [Gallionella sp.]
MKPVAIFRHLAHEGAGYFAEFLYEHKIPFQLIAIDAGDAIPDIASAYSGLVFMGGNMSVNDDLPWIERELSLIRDAVSKDIPVLGHCLGGQLIAKALGGSVSENSVKEIGWGAVRVADDVVARHWFGDVKAFMAFHWHGETFSLPAGATHLLSSEFCANQAYVIGKHFGLQCHIEMTEEMIDTWCELGAMELYGARYSPAVQTATMIRRQMFENLLTLRSVAAKVYSAWLQGVV